MTFGEDSEKMSPEWVGGGGGVSEANCFNYTLNVGILIDFYYPNNKITEIAFLWIGL